MKAALQGILVAGALGAAAAWVVPAQAQTGSHSHHAMVPAAKVADSEMSEGEVRKVDKENRKITLKHGPLKNLDMPPMTMVFQVSDPAMLDKLQPGDKIRAKISRDGGRFTVTEIQPAK